jgi:shikimate dehydrogenase
MDEARPRLAAVLGNPISHSKSPRMHNYWLKQNKLNGYYIPIKVELENFEETIWTLVSMGFSGVNVTIPHKLSALKIADESSSTAQYIGAANTLTFTKENKIYADNTDAYGFINNIKCKYPDWDPKKGISVVLGAGGASRAVIAALLSEGSKEIIVLNRTIEKAEALKEDYDNKITVESWKNINEVVASCSNIINTTSLGMNNESLIAIKPNAIPETALVSDLVYTPLETNFLKMAKNRGSRTVDGLGMLIHQGVPGFEAWFGQKPLVTEELRKILIK